MDSDCQNRLFPPGQDVKDVGGEGAVGIALSCAAELTRIAKPYDRCSHVFARQQLALARGIVYML